MSTSNSDTTTEAQTQTATDTAGEPTGADPDGTVDVATGDTETQPVDSEASAADADTNSDAVFAASIEAEKLAEVIDNVAALVDECKVRLSPDDGLRVRAVDPANVGMVDLTVETAAWESWVVGDDEVVLGVNLDRFEEIIDMANKGDLVQMKLREVSRELEIQIDNISYTLGLIDPDAIRHEPDIPDLDLPAEVTFEGSLLKRGVTAADMVSDHIRLRVNSHSTTDSGDTELSIEAEGDTDDVDLTVPEADLISVVDGKANSRFSLEYLKDMARAIDGDQEITMELGEEFPFKLHSEIVDGFGNLTYMLAPRIDSN